MRDQKGARSGSRMTTAVWPTSPSVQSKARRRQQRHPPERPSRALLPLPPWSAHTHPPWRLLRPSDALSVIHIPNGHRLTDHRLPFFTNQTSPYSTHSDERPYEGRTSHSIRRKDRRLTRIGLHQLQGHRKWFFWCRLSSTCRIWWKWEPRGGSWH